MTAEPKKWLEVSGTRWLSEPLKGTQCWIETYHAATFDEAMDACKGLSTAILFSCSGRELAGFWGM